MKIVKAGILSTIQDAGRPGHRAAGIGRGGVMDAFAHAALNRLLGNEALEAVIEMHFPAAEIFFEEEAVFALTGGDFEGKLNDAPVQCWKTYLARPGDILRFAALRKGYRVYFSIKGGFIAEAWLGSCSTHLSVHRGGHRGRALQKEDILLLKDREAYLHHRETNIPDALIGEVYGGQIIHCVAGPEFEELSDNSKKKLISDRFIIGVHADRMGYRLHPTSLSLKTGTGTMLSSAVCSGMIQLMPDGGLVILMADCQTTGGYPRVLAAISADQPKLAQLRPGDPINFRLLTMSEAEDRHVSLQAKLYEKSTDG